MSKHSFSSLHIGILFVLLFVSHSLWAQRERTTLFGIGRSNQYDTYLSPQEYEGPQFSVLHLTERNLKRDTTVSFKTVTQIEIATTKNGSNTARDLDGMIHFDAGWYKGWSIFFPGFQLQAGGQMGADAGGLYNNRNQNNPAQARASMELSASVAAKYNLHIRKRSIGLRYQADLPLLGGMFSPQYGQSYYNIFSQGNYDHNIVFTHPGNALSLRQLFMVSIPIKHNSITVGYLSDLRQSTPHHLRQHQYSRSFMIGWTYSFPNPSNSNKK